MDVVVLEKPEAIDRARQVVSSLAPGDPVEVEVRTGEDAQEASSLGSEVSDFLVNVLRFLASGSRWMTSW